METTDSLISVFGTAGATEPFILPFNFLDGSGGGGGGGGGGGAGGVSRSEGWDTATGVRGSVILGVA